MIEKKKFSDKTILYLVHDYSNFQKDPIEEAAQYFKKVYVLVRYKPISKIARYLPIKWLKKYDDSYVVDMKDVPSNVEVIRTPVWYLPYGIFYKWSGDLHFRAVERAIKKYNIKFDIVHSHFIWSAGYVGMKLKEKYKIPFVVTGHGFDVYSLPFESKSWMNIVKKILNNADAILTVSNYNYKFLRELKIDESKISVVNNGYNRAEFFVGKKELARGKLKMDKNSKICVSVGNLEKIKGHSNLISALNSVFELKNNTYCYLVGGGSQERYLKELIVKNNLEEKVILVGPKQHSEIKDWINACDVFIIPSLRESASVVLLEALACGRPVVATKVGIVPDVLVSTDYGYVVDVNDVAELSNKIGLALERNWDETKIKNSVSSLSWDRIVGEIMNIYEKLLRNKN